MPALATDLVMRQAANGFCDPHLGEGQVAATRRVLVGSLDQSRRPMLLLPNNAIRGQECGTFHIGTNN
jgi:hypothetical protein